MAQEINLCSGFDAEIRTRHLNGYKVAFNWSPGQAIGAEFGTLARGLEVSIGGFNEDLGFCQDCNEASIAASLADDWV